MVFIGEVNRTPVNPIRIQEETMRIWYPVITMDYREGPGRVCRREYFLECLRHYPSRCAIVVVIMKRLRNSNNN